MVTGEDGYISYTFNSIEPFDVEPKLQAMKINYVKEILEDNKTV